MDKSTLNLKYALNAVVVMSTIVTIVNIFAYGFSFSTLLSNIAMTYSLGFATFISFRFYAKANIKIKMNGFIGVLFTMPFIIASIIYFTHDNPDFKEVGKTFIMFPLLLMLYPIMKINMKMLDANGFRSIGKVLKVPDELNYTVLNFTNNEFYQQFGVHRVIIGEDKTVGDMISIDKLGNSDYVAKVAEYNELAIEDLEGDHFTLYEMSII